MNKPKRMLLVANLHSGKRTVRGKLSEIVDSFCAAGYIPTVRTTQGHGDADHIVAGKSNDYELVVCCGGDGTLNETISGMMKSKTRVPIGYIPCGSTNDMANTLALPHNVKGAVKTILEGEPIEHDIGKFGDDKFFTYIASFGAFTRASYATPQKMKNMLGHFAYILAGARELGSIKSYPFRVTYNGKTVEDRFIFGSVSNSTSVGGVFTLPKHEVSLNDGVMEVMLVRAPKNAAEMTSLIAALLKKDFTNKNIIFDHSGNVKFESEKPLYWTIDGEQSDKIDSVVIDDVPCTIQIMQKH